MHREKLNLQEALARAKQLITTIRNIHDVGGGLLRMRIELWCQRADAAKEAAGGMVLKKVKPLRWDVPLPPETAVSQSAAATMSAAELAREDGAPGEEALYF